MNHSTPAAVTLFERYGSRLAYGLAFLLGTSLLLRAGFTRHDPDQFIGHLGLGMACLLIIPCIQLRMDVVSIMFTYLGLLAGVATLVPSGAAILGTIGLLTQGILLILLLRAAHQRRRLTQ
jgi:hypothetical protein